LDRYAARNVNFVPVAPDPHSDPGRAKRAKKTLATSRGLRWAGVPNARLSRVGVEDIKGGARDWFPRIVQPGRRGPGVSVRSGRTCGADYARLPGSVNREKLARAGNGKGAKRPRCFVRARPRGAEEAENAETV